MAFQFTLLHLTFDEIKGKIKVIWFSAGLYFINYARSGHSLLETHVGSHL